MQEQAKSESVFLVSSAIHAKHGIYDTQTRLEQTIETCKSIRNKCDAEIIVLDGGYQDITEQERDTLSKYIDRFYSFADAENVRQIQQVPNHDIVKNMIEIIIFGSFFDKVDSEGWREKYKRIFKMSGRYTLNDNFNYDKHMQAKDKVVIRGPFTSQFPTNITGGVRLQYMSRLWSFDAFLLPYIKDTYLDMFNHMSERLNNKGYIDIEHLLFHHIGVELVENIGVLGVQGNIAPNGVGVSD
jgi:hypothetical protein